MNWFCWVGWHCWHLINHRYEQRQHGRFAQERSGFDKECCRCGKLRFCSWGWWYGKAI